MSAWAAGGGTDRDSDSTQVGAAAGGGGIRPPAQCPAGVGRSGGPGFPWRTFPFQPGSGGPQDVILF